MVWRGQLQEVSVMRRQLVAQVTQRSCALGGCLLAQPLQLLRESVNLVLLADDDLVEAVQQVFGKAGLDFQIGQAFFNSVGGGHGQVS